jgi:hypothetical protein
LTVFLSHQHQDNAVVLRYAEGLRERFGKEKVLLDLWNLAPGDSIINFMNEGLEQATHFVLFWSRNAKNSGAVETEWQVALMRAFRGEVDIVLVCLDDEPVPMVMRQRRYLRHQDGFTECLDELANFAAGAPTPDATILAIDVYHEMTFCRDDSLLIELFSVSENAEIGPFMFTSDIHHSYFGFRSGNGREFQVLTSDDARLDKRNQFGVGFRFTDGGVSIARPANMRLLKLKSCGPALSRLHLQRAERWQALPLNRVTDRTSKLTQHK